LASKERVGKNGRERGGTSELVTKEGDQRRARKAHRYTGGLRGGGGSEILSQKRNSVSGNNLILLEDSSEKENEGLGSAYYRAVEKTDCSQRKDDQREKGVMGWRRKGGEHKEETPGISHGTKG